MAAKLMLTFRHFGKLFSRNLDPVFSLAKRKQV